MASVTTLHMTMLIPIRKIMAKAVFLSKSNMAIKLNKVKVRKENIIKYGLRLYSAIGTISERNPQSGLIILMDNVIQ